MIPRWRGPGRPTRGSGAERPRCVCRGAAPTGAAVRALMVRLLPSLQAVLVGRHASPSAAFAQRARACRDERFEAELRTLPGRVWALVIVHAESLVGSSVAGVLIQTLSVGCSTCLGALCCQVFLSKLGGAVHNGHVIGPDQPSEHGT